MNEDALPDDQKKESILCSVGTTDIKTITFGSTEPACNEAGTMSRLQQNPPKEAERGD
jgi:hypothetical protein